MEKGKGLQPLGLLDSNARSTAHTSDFLRADPPPQVLRFVERLAGRADAPVTLVAIRPGDEHPPAERGTIAQSWTWAQQQQQQGRGIFITVNETRGKSRKKVDITKGSAFWIDDDVRRDRPRSDWPLAPHMIVESSPGKFHYYWLADYSPGPNAEELLKRMIASHPGADTSVWDMSRVLRLPDTVNLKPEADGHVVRIVHMAHHPRYGLSEVVDAWPTERGGACNRSFDKEAALAVVSTGAAGMHEALRDLAAHEIALGRSAKDVKAELADLISEHDDGSPRFKDRKADIARLVDSAVAKFTPVQPTADGFDDEPIDETPGAQKAKAKAKVKGTHHGYATALLAGLRDGAGGHDPVGAEGSIYVVNESGLYVARSVDEIAIIAARRFDGRPKCERRSDYKSIGAHAYGICEQPGFFDGAPLGMAGSDGFFRVTPDGELAHEKLAAKHRQRHMHAVSPKAGKRQRFDEYLAQTFASSLSNETAAQIAFVQEVAGAIALGLMADHEKVVLLYGPGRAGKGTLLKIFEALVPPDSRTSVSPFKWDSEYYLASLAGKLLNVVGELPDDQALPGAYFKTVTGRDLLTGRHPTHRPFSFRSIAAHIFNSNAYPPTRDHSEAFYTRWCIVSFPNSRIGSGTIETGLAARIVEEELAAILAWALEGAQRLVTRGRFEMTDAHRRHLAAWQRRTDSVMEFLHDEDACMLDEFEIGLRCRRVPLYHGYVRWCIDAGRRAIGKQKFYEALDTPTMSGLGIRVVRTAEDREVVHGVWLRDGNDGF